jgi:hypothetical protein
MRTRTKAAGLLLVVTATLALAGCVQPSPPVIPTSEPSSTPVFATDAAALAAAKTAFTGYVTASDQIGNDGGANPQRITPWVTKDRVSLEIKQFDTFAKTGNHFVGSSTFTYFRLQQISQSPGGNVVLSVYACDDLTDSRLISPTGADITPSTRQNITPIQVEFENAKAGATTLLVEGSTIWSGKDFC